VYATRFSLPACATYGIPERLPTNEDTPKLPSIQTPDSWSGEYCREIFTACTVRMLAWRNRPRTLKNPRNAIPISKFAGKIGNEE
jgi:hypothetical protein